MTYSYPSPLLPAHTGAQSQYANVSQNQLSPYLPVPMIPMAQVPPMRQQTYTTGQYAYATNHLYMPRGPPMRLSNSSLPYVMASRDLNINNPHAQHYVPAAMHSENFPRQRIDSDANVARTNQQDLQNFEPTNAASDNDNSYQRVGRANRESVEEVEALEDSEEVQLIDEISVPGSYNIWEFSSENRNEDNSNDFESFVSSLCTFLYFY
jgi:hypothetical protein